MRYFGKHGILKSITLEIKEYNGRKDRIATLIVIHYLDMPTLIKEMIEANMVSNEQTVPFQLNGIRLIRTKDISQGMFSVTGE